MPEERYPRDAPEEYEETLDPRNPPNSVLNPEVRRRALWVYLGPIVVIAIVIAIAFAYWATRDGAPVAPVVEPTTGLSDEPTPGGGSPVPRPDTTEEELDFRGN